MAHNFEVEPFPALLINYPWIHRRGLQEEKKSQKLPKEKDSIVRQYEIFTT